MTREALPFVVEAAVSSPGYEPTTATLNLKAGGIAQTHLESNIDPPSSDSRKPEDTKTGEGVMDNDGTHQISSLLAGLLDSSFLLIIPALAGIVFWAMKHERVNNSLGRLFRRQTATQT